MEAPRNIIPGTTEAHGIEKRYHVAVPRKTVGGNQSGMVTN